MLRKILELEVWNTTPLLIGGYDTQASSDIHAEELRTQSIKGVWRWWLRAALAGKYYMENVRNLEEAVRREEGEILGFTEKGHSQSSRISIRFIPTSNPQYEQAIEKVADVIPRIKLLTLGGRPLNYIKNIKGLLSLWLYSFQGKELEKDRLKITILSFLTALILSGIGKGGRRGLGCLDFRITQDQTRTSDILGKEISPNSLRELIRQMVPPSRTRATAQLPSIPSIAPNVFKLWFILTKGKRVEEVLRDLQEFTLRSRRSMILRQDEFRQRLIAWILGLPRVVRRTGYIPPNEVQRRASPLIFSIHKDFATACIFKSIDWPKSLTWSNGFHRSPIEINNETLNIAYEILEANFLKYLEAKRYDFEEVKVW